MEDRDYQGFVQVVKQVLNIDLNLYKEKQMKRRLGTLRDKLGFSTFAELAEAIRHSAAFREQLLERITINVTEFFRNPDRWEVLERNILPQLQNRPLRCWSTASSTGEEPYTLALVLESCNIREYRIWASDIDGKVLEQAKVAWYPPASVKEVPPAMLRSHFVPEHGGYRFLREKLSGEIQFFLLDLLRDPFPQEMDLIICRNVVIYFTQEAKERLYQRLSDSLVSGGYLFVGSTEQIFQPQKYNLEPAEPFFYQKR